jgi:Holin of 3TMs, for gene-transfer release
MFPLSMVSSLVTGLLNGPISKALDGFISDVQLRRKLEAELEQLLLTHMGKALEQEAAIVLAEVKSEHWLTRSWRPMLMLTLLGIVLFFGLALPLADGLAGRTLAFNPRWNDIPPPLWDFLMIGMGGYIGGRSLEKIATQVLGQRGRK